jgi:hypothetical protein
MEIIKRKEAEVAERYSKESRDKVARFENYHHLKAEAFSECGITKEVFFKCLKIKL